MAESLKDSAERLEQVIDGLTSFQKHPLMELSNKTLFPNHPLKEVLNQNLEPLSQELHQMTLAIHKRLSDLDRVEWETAVRKEMDAKKLPVLASEETPRAGESENPRLSA
jgi:hypothetical protein